MVAKMYTEDWKMEVFEKKGLHILHLNINSLLPKIDEFCYIVKQPNVSIIGLCKSKLYLFILNIELDIKSYDLIRMNCPRRGSWIECHIRKSKS